MAFYNKIRLPFQLHSPQFPDERSTFRKANGVVKTLSVVIRKTYQLETDYLPERLHQRLKIALAHDTVSVEGDTYLGLIAQDGDYTIEWPEGVLHYPTAKANATVQVTPFDASNSNCQTCDELSQVVLEDDEVAALYGEPLQEDTDYTADLAANDDICCYPAVFSLVSWNADYLDSASIDAATGELTIHTKTGLASISHILLATYRVTCPNGGYDEANVYADIEGSEPAVCGDVSDLVLTPLTSTTAHAEWADPFAVGDFYWELYEGSLPVGSPVQTGSLTSTGIDLVSLTPGTTYYFQVRSVCYGSTGNFVGSQFTTNPEEETCGSYQVSYFDPSGVTPIYTQGWADCNGFTQYIFIPSGQSRTLCALESSPGNPVLLATSNPNVTITYLGPC